MESEFSSFENVVPLLPSKPEFRALQLALEEPRPISLPIRIKDRVAVTLKGPEEEQFIYLDEPTSDLEVGFNAKEEELTITERIIDRENPDNSLVVVIHLNQKNSELLELEGFSDQLLVGSVAIVEGGKPWSEYRQTGFKTSHLHSLLDAGLKADWPIVKIKFILPIAKHPRKWTATLALLTFGKITEDEMDEVQELYRRVYECQTRLLHISQKPSRYETLEELVDEEKMICERMKYLDAVERQPWLEKYEQLIDDIAFAKTREMWLIESERLALEQKAIFATLGK